MFHAKGFGLVDDHVDFDYRESRTWPRVGPAAGMPPSLFVELGEPLRGPALQLVTMLASQDELWLDTHYHGADQFRAVVQGRFRIQRKCMMPGSFGCQMPGIPYREGIPAGGTEPLWMLMVHGERRAARSTTTRNDGNLKIESFGDDQLDRPIAPSSNDYWADIPGGDRGRSGFMTTFGRMVGGFNWSDFSDERDWRTSTPGVQAKAALMGDPKVGPAVLALRAAPGAMIIAAGQNESEIVVAIIEGSAAIGGIPYGRGQVRVQAGGAAMNALEAGPDGAAMIVIIADRRAMLAHRSSHLSAIAALFANLTMPNVPVR